MRERRVGVGGDIDAVDHVARREPAVEGSFEKGVASPDDWVAASGSPSVRYGSARSEDRHLVVGTGDAWRQDVPINGGATHTLSGYRRTPSSGTGDVQIEWRDEGGAVINTSTVTPTASVGWQRFTLTAASSTTAAVEARVILGADSGVVEYDDVQLEENDEASPFTNAPHVTFVRDADLVYASNDRAWSVEMDRGRVRRETTSGWADDLNHVNGRFFDLMPVKDGLQHLTFAAPTGGDLSVEVAYRERYL